MPLDPGHADVFISHASEDKEAIARPLAEALRRRGLTVWYDEYVLRLGDSLRGVIDRGLASARFGVVILSPRFFAKEWPQRELNGLLARETANGRKVLLPVWHELTFEDVVRHSPMLADRLAVSTSRGVEEVARQIVDALEPERPESPKNSLDAALRDFAEAARRMQATVPPSMRAGATAPATARPPAPKPPAPAPSAPEAGRPQPQRKTVVKDDLVGAVAPPAPTARALPNVASRARRAHSSPFDEDRLKALVAFLIAVSVAGAGLWLWNNVPWVAPALQGEEAEALPVTPAKPTGKRPSERGKRLRAEVQTLEALVRSRETALAVLTAVHRALPELLWLDALTFARGELRIEGRTLDTNAAVVFIDNLKGSPPLNGLTLVDAGTTPDGAYRFVAEADVESAGPPPAGTHLLLGPELRRTELLRSMPPQRATPEALRRLHALLEAAELPPTTLTPGTPEDGKPAGRLPISVRLAGSSEAFFSLADRLSRLSFPVVVDELRIRAAPGEGHATTVEMILNVPVATESDATTLPQVPLPEPRRVPSARREPFEPLLAQPVRAAPSGPRPPGIPGLLVDEVEVVGIFRTTAGYVAQVRQSGGSNLYLLKEGDQLYDGDVASITRAEATFKQIVQDPTALKPFREVVKQLQP